MSKKIRLIPFAILVLSFVSAEFIYYSAAEPIINDPNLKAEIVYKGIDFPTSMAFFNSDEILVLEKNNGIVRRIVNGMSLSEPLLDVNLVIGELTSMGTQASNVQNGSAPDGRGGILRVTQNGGVVEGILSNTTLLNLYYAYGIRNSFGMDFDPLSGNLWDTENGPG